MAIFKFKKAPAPYVFPLVSDLKKSDLLGNYFEINILTTDQKICSYDCLYCDLGPSAVKINEVKNMTFPPVLKIVNQLNEKYYESILRDQKVDSILLSGHGDASMHPTFIETSKSIEKLSLIHISEPTRPY